MAFMAALGAFASPFLMAGAQTAMQYEANRRLQGDAQDFTRWQMYNAHQAEVSDLRKAGLNPILSANKGAYPGVGGSPSVSAADLAGSARNLSESRKADMGKELTRQQMELVKLQQQEQMSKNLSSTAQAQLDMARAARSKDFVEAELQNMQANAVVNSATALKAKNEQMYEDSGMGRNFYAPFRKAIQTLKGK